MPLLCLQSNITLISLTTNIESIINVKSEEKRIVGIVGSCILCKKEKRKCNIIGDEYFGVKLENGTYTGVLGLLQSGKGHLYLKGEPDVINEDWLYRSTPMKTENIWAGQVISDENDFGFFDLLSNFKFNLQIYLSYFTVLSIFGLVCLFLTRSKLNPTRNYLYKNYFYRFIHLFDYFFSGRQFSFKLILLFLALFFWFTQLFICNTIKTNKVVVDTSILIKNKDDLMNSKVVCFFKDDTAYSMALNSPKNSFLFRLFDEKIKKSKKCLVDHHLGDTKFLQKNVVMVATQVEIMGIFAAISSLNVLKKIFILNSGIQDYNVVIYQSYQSEYIKKVLTKVTIDHNEFGINTRLYDCTETNSELVYRKSMNIYKEISEYIHDNTGNFSNLELNNFSSIFIVYFSFLSFVFMIFFFFQIVPFYYRKYRR